MAAAGANESDEAFARRLQAQEMGLIGGLDAQTPLMLQHNARVMGGRGANQGGAVVHRNPTVINARLNELSSARATVCAILTVNTPQILATAIVLTAHWDDPLVCDEAHTMRWKYWSLFSAVRMFLYSSIVVLMHIFKSWLDERPRWLQHALSCRNIIDALGLIWFVVGNMWLFGDDENKCTRADRSPIYGLCVSMLVINYVQICLPCIVAMIMIPVFCFCMPCLIRLLARLHDPRATEGAPAAAIDALPLVVIDNEHIRTYLSDNGTCPICLNDMLLGEEARLLQCKHIFHKQCVDEWLRVNASCPTCRYRVLDGNDRPGGETQQGGDHGVEIGNTLLRGEGQGQGQLQGQGQGQGGGHEPSGLIRQTESPSGEIPRQLRLNVNLGR